MRGSSVFPLVVQQGTALAAFQVLSVTGGTMLGVKIVGLALVDVKLGKEGGGPPQKKEEKG